MLRMSAPHLSDLNLRTLILDLISFSETTKKRLHLDWIQRRSEGLGSEEIICLHLIEFPLFFSPTPSKQILWYHTLETVLFFVVVAPLAPSQNCFQIFVWRRLVWQAHLPSPDAPMIINMMILVSWMCLNYWYNAESTITQRHLIQRCAAMLRLHCCFLVWKMAIQ